MEEVTVTDCGRFTIQRTTPTIEVESLLQESNEEAGAIVMCGGMWTIRRVMSETEHPLS